MNTVRGEILKNIIERKFDIELYKKFVKEFFNEIEELPNTKHTGIWREYSEHVNSYYTIAKYSDSKNNKIVVMAVELKKDISIDRARSMQRNFISKILDENNYEAAIVAFYTDTDTSWRLSFVRLDYSFTDKGLELDLTPSRRYSYLVGENEPNHTVLEQLLPIFEDDKNNPSLDDIESAFSVEKVTTDFFNKYRDKYLDLKEYLENHDSFIKETNKLGFEVDKFSEQFAKKLMGQLAFLYFIQKKGWLGVLILPENRELSMSEYIKIYDSQDDTHKNILGRLFRKTKTGKMKLFSKEFFTINDHEAELLSHCFVGTEFDKPWGSGKKQFIREIFNFCIEKTNKNFFNDYLQPFFYQALNKKRRNNYSKIFNCKIPFLNGGLFEPIEGYHWKDVNFEIPNSIFSNEKENGRNADGILDIFDHFNFTMNEDEPLEKEVAIDPEMLGKIFENLLDVKDRKSKGAFYTPREIVHYMCQESLINYLVDEVNVPYEDMKEFILYGELIKDSDSRSNVGYGKELTIKQSIFDNIVKIDNALENVRIADPAVGSGAFPLGMLNEIIRARNNITEYIIRKDKEGTFGKKYGKDFIIKRRSPYKMKWNTIKDCIFAVDIEPSAVDITKLRLWLSVIVDQVIDDETPEPHPLPNLDMNIHVGNSLLDEYEGIQLFDKNLIENSSNKKKSNNLLEQMRILFDSDEILKLLFERQSDYFEVNDELKKLELKNEIEQLKDDLIIHKLNELGNKDAINKYNQIKSQRSKPYFIWELEFAKVFKEKGGFNIVIGNPPYIGEEGNKEMFQQIANSEFGSKYYIGKMDFWYFFTSKGIELLTHNGVLSFIAPNNWMTTAGGKNMRKHIAKSTKIQLFITFNNVMIFDSASQQTMIFVLKKIKQTESYKLKYKAIGNRKLNNNELKNFLLNDNIGICFNTMYSPKEYYEGKSIQFLNFEISNLIEKIKHSTTLYLNNDEILNGIHPHHAAVAKKMLDLLSESKVGDGIFILSNDEIQNLNLSETEMELLRPYYDSSNIRRYLFDKKDTTKKIIYTTSDFKNISLINKYPAIKKHLDKYVDVITSDNRPYGLHRARKQQFFDEPSIASLRKCKVPTFTYIEEPAYLTAEYYLIKTERINMKYLTCLLNSTLIKFWLLKMGKMQGNIYQIDKDPLVNIPIAVPNNAIENDIINLYQEIVKNANVSIEIERKIDDLVYEIYKLDESEVLIIQKTIEEWEGKGAEVN